MPNRLLLKKNDRTVRDSTLEIPANGIISVGSDPFAALSVPDPNIAREQFIIVCEEGKYILLNRADGTIVNQNPLAAGALQPLDINDLITIGEYSILITDQANAESKNTFESQPEPHIVVEPVQTEAADKSTAENPDSQIHTTMNDVLENLRADEKFYFLIEDEVAGKRRIYVDFDEMWLGWTTAGLCIVSENPADIFTPRAQVRKDWSGVVLYPSQTQTVRVNDQILDEPCRLKNNDSLNLQSPSDQKLNTRTSVKFHEPTALLVLNSILPKALPKPVSINQNGNSQSNTNRPAVNPPLPTGRTKNTPKAAGKFLSRKIFGYFTVFEIMVMTIGTLVTAALIHIVLVLFELQKN